MVFAALCNDEKIFNSLCIFVFFVTHSIYKSLLTESIENVIIKQMKYFWYQDISSRRLFFVKKYGNLCNDVLNQNIWRKSVFTHQNDSMSWIRSNTKLYQVCTCFFKWLLLFPWRIQGWSFATTFLLDGVRKIAVWDFNLCESWAC